MAADAPPPRHRRLALQLGAIALGAFGFGFALVPLYDVLCSITGYGDKKRLNEAALVTERPDETRTVTVDFLAMVPSVGSWEFHPEQRSIQVHPGQLVIQPRSADLKIGWREHPGLPEILGFLNALAQRVGL